MSEDVIPAAASSPADSTPSDSGTVTLPAPADRPVENAVAEFNRKFGRIERQIEALTEHLTTLNQPKPTSPATETSDEELWRLAQQGDRGAFDLYMGRVAARTAEHRLTQHRRAELVDQQLLTLGQKYPVLNDVNHPLTQTCQMAYQLLLQQGYPATRATLLEAIKTSLADRPDLVAEVWGQTGRASDAARQSASKVAQAGQTPVMPRAEPAPPAKAPKPLTAEEQALASRMGVKDAAKSKERFRERMAQGRSALGSVATFVQGEEI